MSEAHFSSISTRTALTRRRRAVFAGKDPDLDRAPFQFLLDRALDRVGCTQALSVVLGQREDGEAFGDILLQPISQFGGGVAIAGDELGERGFRLGEILCRPDRFQLSADAPGGLGTGGVMDGVAGQVELAALPSGAAEDGAPGGAQAAVVVGDDEVDPAQPARDEALESEEDRKTVRWTVFPTNAPVDLGLRQGHRHAQHTAALDRADADGREHGDVAQ